MRGDYFKASCDLPQSSLWAEDAETCKLWITILALKDRNHIVTKNLIGLSHASRIPIDRTREIIEKFLSPDPYSTTPDHEGRRLKELPEGYLVLNGEKYREMGWSDDKKEYERQRKRDYRKKQAEASTPTPKVPNPANVPPAPKFAEDTAQPEKKIHPDTRTALHYLNEKVGRSYRETDSNLTAISARLKEKGVDLAGVKVMIDRMVAKWKGTDQSDYLRPETLFGATKFDGYYAAREEPIHAANTPARLENPRNAGCHPNTTNYEEAAKARGVAGKVDAPELPLS